MGYRSDVRIKMGNKAYGLLEKKCLESDNEYIKKMVTEPSIIEKNEDYTVIGWTYIKWNSYYEDVKAVMNVLKELDDIVENNDELLKDFYYKLISIGEDNATEESSNDYDEEYTEDFYVEFNFSL